MQRKQAMALQPIGAAKPEFETGFEVAGVIVCR
jgi:hypothetical protein